MSRPATLYALHGVALWPEQSGSACQDCRGCESHAVRWMDSRRGLDEGFLEAIGFSYR